MDKQDYIFEILKQLKNNTFSVFCGSGATIDATKKGWIDIFSDKTQNFYKAGFNDDIYFLADIEKNYFCGNDKNEFYKDIINNFPSHNIISEHIDSVLNLNINQVWTTNYDNIIEESIYRIFGVKPTIIKDSSDLLREPLNKAYTVYKLNGSVTKWESMILTRTDYMEYFKKQRLFFELLKRQLVLDTFLFIGYSFRDNLVLNALQEIKEVFPENGKTHYRFAKRDEGSAQKHKGLYNEYFELENKYFEDKYNIKTIEINNYCEIDFYLREIYRMFCNSNVFICGSFRNITKNKRILIEKIVDLLISKLMLNNFRIYSGNGRGLGEIVVACVDKHTRAMNHTNIPFVNRPYIFTNDTCETKHIQNNRILKDCNTIIVICGQDDELGESKNVDDQISTYIENMTNENFVEPLIIPIPMTGYSAAKEDNLRMAKETPAYLREPEQFDKIFMCKEPKDIKSPEELNFAAETVVDSIISILKINRTEHN